MSEYPPTTIVRQLKLFRPALRLITADSSNRYDGVNEDYVISGNTAGTYLNLPGFFLPYPSLKDYGFIWYRATGRYQHTAGANTLVIEPVVDGTPTSVQVSSGALTAAAGNGFIVIDVKLQPVHSENNTAYQPMIVNFYTGTTSAKVNDVTASVAQTISVTADHTIYFRLGSSTSTGDASRTIDMRSFTAFHMGPRTL